MGAIAALTTKTNTIAFIGGMDIPLIRRFFMGYEAGAKAVNPTVKILPSYVSNDSDGWVNPAKAKEMALAQYGGGADIIFTAAGASGLGVFDAAEDQKRLAIGVDSNQNWMKPGFILTSMLKRVDVGVYEAIEELVGGSYTYGVKHYGLKNSGIDYAMDEHNKGLVTPEVIEKVESLKKGILSGKIVVPDYYHTTAKN